MNYTTELNVTIKGYAVAWRKQKSIHWELRALSSLEFLKYISARSKRMVEDFRSAL